MGNLPGKRVLVTGASGFIASHLTRRLVGMNCEVALLTRYNSVIDNIRIVDLWDRVTIIEADLRNNDALARIGAFGPQIIYHFAAYNHVGGSFGQVSEVMDVNGKGTANLVAACRDFERFIYISTSEVYGRQDRVPFDESMTPRPVSPYAVAKYAGELYCRMVMEEFGQPFIILRPFNAFGPYQSPRAVITEIILDCLAGDTIRTTEGKQTREFNFISNLVDAFVSAGTRDDAIGQIINVGCGEDVAICDLVDMIHRETDSTSDIQIGALENRPTEIWEMRADIEKCRRLLDWSPQIPFDEGLRKTIEWYRLYRHEFTDPESGIQRLAGMSSRI